MKKRWYLILIVLSFGILYYFGVLKTRYIMIGANQTLEVNESYRELGFKKLSWFQNLRFDLKVEGKVNNKVLGDYVLKYYDGNTYIGKRIVSIVDSTPPKISLKQPEVFIYLNQKFDLKQYVDVQDNYDKIAFDQLKVSESEFYEAKTYDVLIEASDSSGNKASTHLPVVVLKDPTTTTLKYHHDQYDNTYLEWWFHKSENHQRMNACYEQAFLEQYHAYYLGKNDKVIYLTFDEGGNDVTYIKEIAQILNKHDVKATFFVTRNYLLSESAFMKTLIEEGHLIGNHTWHHYDMTSLANQQDVDSFVLELTNFEKSYIDLFHKEMIKVFRFPKGGASERSLQMVNELGYKTFYWSFAYYDFAHDVSMEEAYDKMIKYYHPGAIYMLHPSNKGNYEALEAFILKMKELGYRFELVSEIS